MKITDLPSISFPGIKLELNYSIPSISIPSIHLPSIQIFSWCECYNCGSNTNMMFLADFPKDVCQECYNKVEIRTYIEKYIKLSAFK